MPAHRVQRHTRRHFGHTTMQPQPPLEQRRQCRHHILHLVGFVHRAVGHFRAGAEAQFGFLQMHRGVGKQPQVAGMIPVQMGENQVLDARRIYVQLA
ncbi:hypothetical protein D3C73_927970 [compost metagenome]